jgi:lipopolysaccharide/colanic/teichoic acid biosynthesis glycosyltransferase
MFREVLKDVDQNPVPYRSMATPRWTGGRVILKRVMDIVISASALMLFAPVLSLLILLVKRDGGPAFYAQWRVGRGGKYFRCYKIRSMVMDSDRILEELLARDERANREYQLYWKLSKDPRITPIGAILRRYSLDELPQLLNILRGDMSIVGPRPRSINELHRTNFLVRGIDPYLSVRPGLTGLWQISGRNNIDLEGKIRLDTKYVETWSINQDVTIIMATFRVVFMGDGAS